MYEHFWLTVHAVKFPLTKCAASSHVFAPANIYGLWGGGGGGVGITHAKDHEYEF